MSFDFKKEYKEFYMPKKTPSLVTVPKMNYIAVRGKGNPNEENGEYKKSIETLYTIAFTIKMSYKGDYKIDGYFEYVVPPLEGLWWHDKTDCIDLSDSDKASLNFVSMIRLPDFVTEKDFNWAIKTAEEKKKKSFSNAEFLTYSEGLCVQCMHIGSYDDEAKTIGLMEICARENGYEFDLSNTRRHHEIYLSDPRRCDVSRLKTVLRYPIVNIREKCER